jgi:Tol biopolymer transport system component
VSFGLVPVGQAEEQSIVLEATGTATVNIRSVQLDPSGSPAFSILAPTVRPSLPAHTSGTIRVRYLASKVGSESGAVVVESDAMNAPHLVIPICGQGGTPALCNHPVPLDFGRVAPPRTATGTLELSNCGNAPLSIYHLAISQDLAHPSAPGFGLAPTALPVTLAPGEKVTPVVSFQPVEPGAVDGYLEVDSNAMDEPKAFFPLTARGTENCDLSVVPPRLDFTGIPVGSSGTLHVLVANESQDLSCSITRIEVTQEADRFSVDQPPSLPDAIAPGQSAILVVRYTPPSAGSDQGALEIEAGRTIHRLPLIGNVPLGPGCHLAADPAFMSFGVVSPGGTRTETIAIRNVSTASTCTLSGLGLAPGSALSFGAVTQSLGSLSPGAISNVSVTFAPSSPGPARGSLRITSTDPHSPLDVPLFGAAPNAQICVIPSFIRFPTISSTAAFEIVACGGAPLTVTDVSFSIPGAEFSLFQVPRLPLDLRAGDRQTVTLAYRPMPNPAPSKAEVAVRSNDPDLPVVDVELSGGPVVVPPAAGRYLYYWQVPSGTVNGGDGNIMQLDLQGRIPPLAVWGTATGKACVGCHSVSPDGRYLSFVDTSIGYGIRMIDLLNNVEQTLPFASQSTLDVAWRPNVNTTPPYQFAYDDGHDIQIASLTGGILRALLGAADPAYFQKMPSWGPNGVIAFARSDHAGSLSLSDHSDVMLVDERGGPATPLKGASGDNWLHYYPTFSPNGRWIAVTVSASGDTFSARDSHVQLVAADQSGTVLPLPNLNGFDGASTYPGWSIDGSLLSFTSNRATGVGGWDIWFAPIDPITGADGMPVDLSQANSTGYDALPRWSP